MLTMIVDSPAIYVVLRRQLYITMCYPLTGKRKALRFHDYVKGRYAKKLSLHESPSSTSHNDVLSISGQT